MIAETPTAIISERARRLHQDALVWDNHGCMPVKHTQDFLPDLERYRQGGVDVAVINIGDADDRADTYMHMAAYVRGYVLANPDLYVMATSVEAIETAKAEGKLAVALDIEGLYGIGDQLSMIQLAYDLGVRWALMAYNVGNLVGAGCHDAVDNGLTPFGYQVIAEMDRVGMIKCCTHTGYRTAMDVMTGSALPTIFSHSNSRALKDHARNITDEMIDACAKTGGVVCINGIGLFLGNNDVTPQNFVNHIDHIAQRVGTSHIGIGLDFVFDQAGLSHTLNSSASIWPAGQGYEGDIGFLPPEHLPWVTEELVVRGYSDDDIRGILGGNMMRVAKAVWK
jgi:membrane dipeptidase